jgi:hypothetical protein
MGRGSGGLYHVGAWIRARDMRSGAEIFTHMASVAPTALRIFLDVSHPFRGGLTYAAPTALVWSNGDATRRAREAEDGREHSEGERGPSPAAAGSG